ncbi:conserved domain protein [alpha proteobacterium U9-1i]|nr:conserved domain protein [alpha proteobacterium U9-1i]
MKRIALAAIAAATFAAPLAISTPAMADDHRGRHERGWDRHDRDYDNRDDRRDERRAYREGRRDERRADRWDDRRYNGYHYQGRWHYGPPPRHYRDVRYDYRSWRRGDRLPAYYRDRYYDVDYRDYRHLRPPPRGYRYYRDDRGDIILAAIATGIIASVILNN